MPLRRKIVTAGVSVVFGLALAACGQQVVSHVSAADTVHSALTGVFSSPTTRFDVTAQNLPGVASLADGSFSIVITTSTDGSGQSTGGRSLEISVYQQSNDLADVLSMAGSVYFRLDMKDILALAGPTASTTVSNELGTLAARPGLGFLSDLSLGKWVGVSAATYSSVSSQLLGKLPPSSAASSLSEQKIRDEVKKAEQLSPTIESSVLQAIQTWLSVAQKTSDEYSLALPIRAFAGSIVAKLTKPLESILNIPSIPQAEVTKTLAEIPENLSLKANVWVEGGSLTKIQAFIPRTSAYLMIGVSHPAAGVQAPTDATLLTAADLTALFGDLGAVSKMPAISIPGFSLPTTTSQAAVSSSAT